MAKTKQPAPHAKIFETADVPPKPPMERIFQAGLKELPDEKPGEAGEPSEAPAEPASAGEAQPAADLEPGVAPDVAEGCPVEELDADAVESLARDLFIATMNSHVGVNKALDYLAGKAFEQARAFYAMAGEERK